MKKFSFIVTTAFMLCLFFAHAYADSTSVTPSGVATQPDIDMQGSDILNAGAVDTDNLNSDQVTTDSLTATNGSITTLTSNQSTTNTATIGNANIGNAAVTGTMNAGRVLVSRTPTAGSDLTNRAYVISLISTLQSQITGLQSQINGQDSGKCDNSKGLYWTGEKCRCLNGCVWSPTYNRCKEYIFGGS